MLAREQFGLKGNVQSDSANVIALCNALYDLPGLRFMRDPTRGGLATVLHEINQATKLGLRIQQVNIPIRDAVNTVCEMLGYDPLFLACEGRVVAVLSEDDAEEALDRWRAMPAGADSHLIGEVDSRMSRVVLETELGGERILQELEDDPLPRIC
jgi:hydrogenase expression/formation protein HypE